METPIISCLHKNWKFDSNGFGTCFACGAQKQFKNYWDDLTNHWSREPNKTMKGKRTNGQVRKELKQIRNEYKDFLNSVTPFTDDQQQQQGIIDQEGQANLFTFCC